MDCKEKNCKLKGYWTETAPTGETLLCFKVRHNGKNHVQKLTLKEVQTELSAKRFFDNRKIIANLNL